MSKTRIVLDSAGVMALLNSAEIQGKLMELGDVMQSRANGMASTPGAEYHAVAVKTPGRGIVRVSAANRAGVRDNLNNNTLIKAMME
nr:MAG TPA_asm: type I neck protein [Caudoviricetes sp.]